jgi:hypothetical protein
VVCTGRGRRRAGAWVDGRWLDATGPPLFPPWRHAPCALAGPGPGGSIVLLRRAGGELPALGGAPGRLAEGLYSGLAVVQGRLVAVAESEPPRLVPVGF